MRKSVAESYSQLWHYTDAVGLHGILTSQQLWATDIFYLNDAEEFTGFFDRKLLHLLKDGVQKGIVEARKTAQGLSAIKAIGGSRVVEEEFPNNLLVILRAVTTSLKAYVTSFCVTSSEDGLLSQWRGYGPDGGYAIVFDTKGLDELLLDEQRRYLYAFGHWGDVDYYDGDTGTGTAHIETLEWEVAIRDAIARFIVTRNLNAAAEELFQPVISLATRHKHRGFREESEVRIMAVTAGDEVINAARMAGDKRPKKPVYFTQRSGVLVPHIALFERPLGEAAKLPIRKIIVGPHSEKRKRQKAIETMLSQLGIEAEVVASDIPFIGR